MQYTYDEAKRLTVLSERGLDLADAGAVFEGFYLSRVDEKHSETEQRTITVGLINGEVVVVVIWTPRPGERRIITMWKANEKERRKYHEQRDRSG